MGDVGKRAILTEREVLELIHKRVGWKLADEDLQGEKRWREREGKRQTDGGGRETVGNRAEDTALSQSCLFSAAACGLTGIPSGPVHSFSAPPGTTAIASPAPALPHLPLHHNLCFSHTRGIQCINKGTFSMQSALDF